MGCNTAPAWIEFPVKFLDEEIRKCLEEHEDVEFKDGQPVPHDDPEVSIDDGLLHIHNSEVCYGMFEELEDLLKKKGVPFDRHTSADWDILPVDRHFRPGENREQDFDKEFVLHPETDDIAVNLSAIRELIDDAGEQAAAAIRRYIDENFPTYRPLSDYVGGQP